MNHERGAASKLLGPTYIQSSEIFYTNVFQAICIHSPNQLGKTDF